MAGAFEMPNWPDQVVVFLNGWSLDYTNGDEHIGEVEAKVENAQVKSAGTGLELAFEASARLTDKSNSDPFEFCMYVGFAAWNSAVINAISDLGDSSDNTSVTKNGSVTEVRTMDPSVLFLSRGFSGAWDSDDDHHVQHIAYETNETSASHRFTMEDYGTQTEIGQDLVSRLVPMSSNDTMQASLLYLEPQVMDTPDLAELELFPTTNPTLLPLSQF